ncbi:MAG TPA: MBL fold metallo-hydrolase [Micromonosporaceae bacterium]|nr:MBL fold metallo-hydrolase [Micromonosporaceae bacterium]
MTRSGRHVTAPATELAAGPPAWATLMLASNPGPMTLDGTNSWVLRAVDHPGSVVVDPGPLDVDHLERLAEYPVELVLITHGHIDHTESVDRFREITGAPVRAVDPRWCRDAAPLTPDERIESGGLNLRVIPAPGHTADSVAFAVMLDDPAESAVLTGDTVLGRGTTVVTWPDGDLADYLESLQRLGRLGRIPVLPGHGPMLADCAGAAEFYLAHRADRLDQVRRVLAGGAGTAREVVATVYADVDRELWPAAEMSVRAQLEYLHAQGEFPHPPDEGPS